MQRVICSQFGDPRHLTVQEEPTPSPAPGQVLVKLDAIGVSFVDGLIVRGTYQLRPPLPFTPGSCVAGRIAAVGDDVEIAVGASVAMVLTDFGGYASHVVVPAGLAVPLPDAVSADTAAAALESYLTVVYATTHRVTVRPGEQVVVLGAGGGIGQAAVDVAQSAGAHVVAVASSEDKRNAAKAAGAEITLGYENLKDDIRAATGGGADIVIDPVGGPAAESALRALAAGGRFCVLGFASGDIPRLPANVVLLRNRSIIGVDWGDWSRDTSSADGNVALIADVLARIARDELHPAPPSTAPLADAGEVLRVFGERRSLGKYVLHP